MHSSKPVCGDVLEGANPRLHALDERNRAIDLAERPGRNRQIGHRGRARVMSEAKGELIVAAGLEQRERVFQFTHGLNIFPGEAVSCALDPMGDASLGRIGSRCDAGEEGSRMPSHRREIAPHVVADP